MLQTVAEDVRFAVRSFLRSPAYVLVAVLSLALGIGAITAVFSVVSVVFFEPLPYRAADELVMIWEDERGVDDHWTVAPQTLRDWADRQSSFEELTAFNIDFTTLTGAGDATRLPASIVMPNFFFLLGVQPHLGRTFLPAHGEPGGSDVVVLSYGLWQSSFGGDASVIGSTIRLDGTPHTVLGVMPPEFVQPEPAVEDANPQLWRPFSLAAQSERRDARYLRVMGRLRYGTTLESARREMTAIAAGIAEVSPTTHRGWSVNLVPLHDELFGEAGPALRLLLLGAGFVLLIVAVNVANLMLARNQRRSREFAVRAALGAGRGRLARMVLVESLLVALAGGISGTLLVLLGGDVLQAIQARHLTAAAPIEVDLRVVAFMVAVSVATALAFGVLPAARSARPDLRDALTASGITAGRRARRARRGLIIAEIALTVVLLVSTALLTRSFLRLTGTDVGFATRSVLTVEAVLPSGTYDSRERVVGAIDALNERIGAVPGVEAAAVTSDLPFTGWNLFTDVVPEGMTLGADDPAPTIEYRTVSPRYFDVMGLRELSGRAVVAGAREEGGSHRVVVNEAAARRLWPGADPVGRSVTVGNNPQSAFPAVVSGVVSDVLDDGFDSAPEARVYRSHETRPNRWVFFVIRTSIAPAGVAAAVRGEIGAFDGEIAVGDIRSMSELVGSTVTARRIVLQLIMAFAALTLILAAVGIYGVLSYDMSERRREVGLRIALGARAVDVVRLVLGDSLVMASIGLALGIALSLLTSRILASLLFGVGPADPISFIVVVITLGGTAAAAAILPARKAAAVEPIEVLRQD